MVRINQADTPKKGPWMLAKVLLFAVMSLLMFSAPANCGTRVSRSLPAITSLLLGETRANTAPVITASPQTINTGASIAVSTLFSANDPDGDAITLYEFSDPSGAGAISLNGATNLLSSSQNPARYRVSAADLPKLLYVAGSSAASESIFISAYDGTAWGSGSVTVTVAAQQVPAIVGSWSVTGSESATVNIPGYGAVPIDHLPVQDTLTFNSDHSFKTAVNPLFVYGTWSPSGNCWVVDVKQSLCDSVKQLLAESGIKGYLTITSYSVQCCITSGTLSMTAQISGKITITSPASLTASFSMSGYYSGTKNTGAANSYASALGEPVNTGVGNALKSVVLQATKER